MKINGKKLRNAVNTVTDIYRDRERESCVDISGIYGNHKNMPNYGFGHSRVRVYNCACDRRGVLVGLVLIN
jgi:hypothetical protein